MKSIKNITWKYFYNFRRNKPKFWSDVKRALHILNLEKSEWYKECSEYYNFDVKNKIVIDYGCDFGTSPLWFINNDAKKVIGFSLDNQYFKNERYEHNKISIIDEPKKLIAELTNKINEIKKQLPNEIILKADCEGCEWNFSSEFIELFSDWVIALHMPIKNIALENYIKLHGKLIGEPDLDIMHIKREYTIYQKVN